MELSVFSFTFSFLFRFGRLYLCNKTVSYMTTIALLEFALKALTGRGFKPSPVYVMGSKGNTLTSIEVHSSALMMQPNVIGIREFIGDKFKVNGNTNTETIYITAK